MEIYKKIGLSHEIGLIDTASLLYENKIYRAYYKFDETNLFEKDKCKSKNGVSVLDTIDF